MDKVRIGRGVSTDRGSAYLHDLKVLDVFTFRLDKLPNYVVPRGLLCACGHRGRGILCERVTRFMATDEGG